MIISLLSLADYSILKPKAVWFATEILGARFRGLWCQAISVLFAYDLLKGLHLQKWRSGGCQSLTSASAFSSILLALFLASVVDPSFSSLILLVVWFSKKINHWAGWDRSSLLFSNLWDCKTFYSSSPIHTDTHSHILSSEIYNSTDSSFLHILTIFSLSTMQGIHWTFSESEPLWNENFLTISFSIFSQSSFFSPLTTGNFY